MAMHRLEGGGHGLAAVGLALGEATVEGEADGDGALPTMGVEPQAAAISAVTASARSNRAVLIVL